MHYPIKSRDFGILEPLTRKLQLNGAITFSNGGKCYINTDNDVCKYTFLFSYDYAKDISFS